jgi:ppGpp synthetase/RelA/SpoT-type nucleotidyltranferase
MPLTDLDIDSAVSRYRREVDRIQKLVDYVAESCRALVRENAIPATVQWRAKDPGRLRGKLQRKRDEFDSVEEVFSKLKDLAGVRVVTYVESDRERVVAELQQRFVGPDGDDVVPDPRNRDFPSFYRATHCQVALPEEDLVGALENLAGTTCEVQVCSLLAHVWNELEHDLVYKGLTGEVSEEEQAALTGLGYLVRAGDGMIGTLLQATDRRLADVQGKFRDQWDFVARMRGRFPASKEFGTHSGQLLEELVASGLDTPQAIDEQLLTDGADASAERASELVENLRDFLRERGDEVVRLDERTSDPLLLLYLEQHADEVLVRHPAGPGRGRPSRISSAARRFKDYKTGAE